MSKTNLIIIAVVCAFLVVLGFFMAKQDAAGWQQEESISRSSLLPDFEVNKVSKIVVKEDKKTATLVKDKENWKVKEKHDYPANFTKIRENVLKLKDMKIAQNIKVGKSNLGRLNLQKPGEGEQSGTLVEFYDDKNAKINSLLLGKPHVEKQENPNPMFGGPMPDGRYLQVEGERDVYLVSDPLGDFSATVVDWIDKEFFKIKDVKIVSLKKDKKTDWTLERTDKNGKLKLDGIKPDQELVSNKISSISSAFNNLSFDDVLPADSKPQKDGLAKADVVSVKTFDGFSYDLAMAQINGKCYMEMNVSCDIPKKREVKKDEKPEDKEKLDKEFEDKKAELQKKLDSEKFYQNWIYEIPKRKMETLVIARKDLVKAKEKKDDTTKKDSKKTKAPGTVSVKPAKAKKAPGKVMVKPTTKAPNKVTVKPVAPKTKSDDNKTK